MSFRMLAETYLRPDATIRRPRRCALGSYGLFKCSLESINLAGNLTPTWYVRIYLVITNFPEKLSTWKIQDGKLYHYHPNLLLEDVVEDLNAWKLVPSDEERRVVLLEVHDDPQSAHLGVQKTYMRIATRYFWPGCYRDVLNYVKSCVTCQTCKVGQQLPAGMMGHRIVEEPWVVVI